MNIENMFDKPDVKQLVHAFSLLDDEKDIQAFLTDICTPREICDLSQRLQVARYLDEGEPYVEVQARTGASSTTVSRVSKALNGEYGGYRKILIKLEDGEHTRRRASLRMPKRACEDWANLLLNDKTTFQIADAKTSAYLLGSNEQQTGGLLRTGPTGTNVNDLSVLLIGKPRLTF